MTWEQVAYGFSGNGHQQATSEGSLHGIMEGISLGLARAGHVGEKAMQSRALGNRFLGLRNGLKFGLKWIEIWAKMGLKMDLKKNRPNKIK